MCNMSKKKKNKYLTVPSVSLVDEINSMSLLDEKVKTGLINLYKREVTLVENVLKQLNQFVFILNGGISVTRIDIYDYPTDEDRNVWVDGEYRLIYHNEDGSTTKMTVTSR